MTISVTFPSNPVLYQSYSNGSATWVWNGINWTLGQPTLAAVATSGNFNDLINRPDVTSFVQTASLSAYATVASLGAYATTATLATYATQDNLNAVKALTVTVNGTAIKLGGSGSITAASLTGTTLAPTVVSSSLTSVGNLTNLNVVGTLNVGGINVKSFSIAMAAALA
jgi:hypothetical protein